MNFEYFIPESPKSEIELTEEEMFKNIFPSILEKIENFDDINIDSYYYINNPKSQMNDKKNKLDQNEAMNEVLLVDDYEAVFNKLERNLNQNEIEQETELKDNFADFNGISNINYINIEKEDYNTPYFVKNIVSENKCFCPMKNEKAELVINIKETNKKYKFIKDEIITEPINKDKEIIKKTKKKQGSKKKKKKSNTQSSTRRKRGPYKKRPKIVQQINTEDKCFPFTTGKGLINYAFPILQTPSLNYYEDYLLLDENDNYDMSYNQEEMDYKKKKKDIDKEKKEEDLFFSNVQKKKADENIDWWKFTTKKYFIAEDGKKKRIKKKRKYKPDDIRKKIKARFHKIIKNIINENLKKAGSEQLFDFFPQSFIGNITRKVNYESFGLTYKEMLSTDYLNQIGKSENLNIKVDRTKFLKNKEVLKYLENNPEICKRSGFDIIQDMKYKDLLKIYFTSSQFENSIEQLKAENESLDYIQEYTYRARTYIKFYNNYENEKKN